MKYALRISNETNRYYGKNNIFSYSLAEALIFDTVSAAFRYLHSMNQTKLRNDIEIVELVSEYKVNRVL